MKKREPREVAVDLFSRVPELAWVEANARPELWHEIGVDFTFVVEDDAYSYDLQARIAPLVGDFMLKTSVPTEFVVLPLKFAPHTSNVIVYASEKPQEELEPRRARR